MWIALRRPFHCSFDTTNDNSEAQQLRRLRAKPCFGSRVVAQNRSVHVPRKIRKLRRHQARKLRGHQSSFPSPKRANTPLPPRERTNTPLPREGKEPTMILIVLEPTTTGRHGGEAGQAEHRCHDRGSPYLADGHPLVVGEDVGHLPGVEHVVDVLHEGLVDDLGVREEEGHRGAARPRSLEDRLQVLPPLRVPVVLAYLDLLDAGLWCRYVEEQ